MGLLRSSRFWALTIFTVILIALAGVTVFVGIGVWNTAPKDWNDDRKLAAEALVLTVSSLAATLIAAVLALAAFALASERPKLRLVVEIADDFLDGEAVVQPPRQLAGTSRFAASTFHWDNLGPVLWIRIYNDKGFSARNPAVRVEAIGFRLNAGARRVDLNQNGWAYEDPVAVAGTSAWIWDGMDKAIHGPRWFRPLPPLRLVGLSPTVNVECSITIEGVAEGDQVTQTIRFTP
jgi:hypothetical protein